MWDLSCPDWADRLRTGRSLIPDLPLNRTEAELGLAFFDELRLPDVPGAPMLGDAAGQWFRDIVSAAFGSWFPELDAEGNWTGQGRREVRDIFALAPKGSSKTSYGAGLALAVMLMNKRPNARAQFVGPTQSISERAYHQAAGMIELSKALKDRFRTKDHLKTIVDVDNQSELKVSTFGLDVQTGGILIFAHLDEIHVLGRNVHTSKVIRQIRGGLDKTPEGLFLITTTQSDDAPAGAFKSELHMARKIRDGAYRGKTVRATLPVLYEFPENIGKDPAKWQDPANWPMVMPNLGRSVHLATLVPDWETERAKGEEAVRIWASQHLNIEIGIGLKTDAWAGAEFWAGSEDEAITLELLIEVCDVIVFGLDGGGLDDLYGAGAIGRHKETKEWLAWSRAWCHDSVLERRQSIASRLLDFKEAGELTICQHAGEDVADIVDLIRIVKDRGLLGAVSVDPAGLGEMVEALAAIDVTVENGLLIGAPQGYGMMTAIKTAERRLENGCVPEDQRKSDLSMRHAKSALMDWCVGNVKIEPTATAIRATKQNAGDAKIDPWAALMNAVAVMVRNPEPAGSVYTAERGILMFEA